MSDRRSAPGGTSPDDVEARIAECLGPVSRQSFFLFAGAGSGKTRSLVAALRHVQANLGASLRLKGQRVGVITYTNAACDEIRRRLQADPLIDVSTIHSFAWSLIEDCTPDLRTRLREMLVGDIEELRVRQQKGRAGKASIERAATIESKTRRLAGLGEVRGFTYSPSGDQHGNASLAHAEVIDLASHLLTAKPVLRAILVGRYPILLIDESQDTNGQLIDALFAVQAEANGRFTLGLIGDMMQRIYSDGREALGRDLPPDWARLGKDVNHRSPKRVIALINKIREVADGSRQVPRPGAPEGIVRLFLLPGDDGDQPAAEGRVAARMAEITGDAQWARPDEVKTLTLEHRMAARRLGILGSFEPLYGVPAWRQSLLAGKLPEAVFFTETVLPLVQADREGDRFGVARIVKRSSPLMTLEAIENVQDPRSHLSRVSAAVEECVSLWRGGADPTLREIVRTIAGSGLFDVPEALRISACLTDPGAARESGEADARDEAALAVARFLDAPFSQVEPLARYLAGKARFDTHHGVKGLEFDRVMVVIDDAESRGFQFKYERLLGGEPTGDRAIEATRRLFYVTCSRAKQSLAVVVHTNASAKVREFVVEQGWFADEEIVTGV